MSDYDWPFPVSRFEMRIQPNQRAFVGPYVPVMQTLDFLGERLVVSLDLPPTNDPIQGAAREAYFNRLKGAFNRIRMGHQKLKTPQGTLQSAEAATWTSGGAASGWITGGVAAGWIGGAPVLAANVQQLASTCVLSARVGKTLLAGDWFGLGGQLVQCMANTIADGSGLMAVEFQPRARAFIAAGSAIVLNGPTATFKLKPGTLNVPTSWTPGLVEGATIELIEDY